MRSVVRSSSRYAYLFVSLNLLILLAFLVSSSLNLREVDSSRDRYEGLVREWFALRLHLTEDPALEKRLSVLADFDRHVTELVSSELIVAASRLSEPLAVSGERVRESWSLLRSTLDRWVFSPAGADLESALAGRVSAFHDALLGLEGVLDEFVDLQQRALQILLYFLGGTIVATIGVFLLVERESERERRTAVRVQSLAQATIGAQERERARIARLLHDSLAQELSVALLEIGELAEGESAAVAERLRARLRSSVDWIRDLAHELHPSEIDQIGLASAISAYCSDLASTSPAHLEWAIGDDVCDIPRPVSINVYRIAQEALTNAIRHARAQRILLRLTADAARLELTVSDDGVGFRDADECDSRSLRGIGIIGMTERANMLDAQLRIDSRPGDGTVVRLSVPAVSLGCVEVL